MSYHMEHKQVMEDFGSLLRSIPWSPGCAMNVPRSPNRSFISELLPESCLLNNYVMYHRSLGQSLQRCCQVHAYRKLICVRCATKYFSPPAFLPFQFTPRLNGVTNVPSGLHSIVSLGRRAGTPLYILLAMRWQPRPGTCTWLRNQTLSSR